MIVGVGNVLIVIPIISEEEQLFEFVTTTEYVPVDEIEIVCVVELFDHKKDEPALPAFSVIGFPAHAVTSGPRFTTGKEFTVTFVGVEEAVHPLAFATVTE